jgi:hypothetical protein
MFVGGMLLFGAVVVLGTSLFMSPYQATPEPGPDHVRAYVADFIRNLAIGTLILTGLAAYLLFPKRRPPMEVRDRIVGGLLVLVTLASLYQIIWVQTAVLN